jgi:hypothetical protein
LGWRLIWGVRLLHWRLVRCAFAPAGVVGVAMLLEIWGMRREGLLVGRRVVRRLVLALVSGVLGVGVAGLGLVLVTGVWTCG